MLLENGFNHSQLEYHELLDAVEFANGTGGLCDVGLKGLRSVSDSDMDSGSSNFITDVPESIVENMVAGINKSADTERRKIPERKMRSRRVEIFWLPATRRA